MYANDVRSSEPTRHGAYVCLRIPADARRAAARIDVPGLADRLGFKGEFATVAGHPPEAIAFLRRVGATAAEIADDELLGAEAVVHVAAPTAGPVTEFCAELTRLLGPALKPRVLGGIVRPPSYTGNAMHNFAYAHQVVQQAAAVMPNAFIVPMCKNGRWWEKGWMERHTYFLPRYDDSGRMLNEGHALVAAPGIACITRRTYRSPVEPAADGQYDFVNFFECADADVGKFHGVCAALRDVARNPEWRFVSEGPTWHGRRVATWAELLG